MLKTDAANRSASANGSAIDDDQTNQPLRNSTLPTSDDSDNRKSRDCTELEALRRIYEQIRAIRLNQAQIIAENATKRAEIQQRFEIEMKKLEELEAEHQETCRNMKGLPEDSDNQTAIVSKYQREQQELEHQRNVVDDLEFQMFEVDAHYDEQKELIQQQLVTEQQMISDVNRVYSAPTVNDALTTTTTTLLTSYTDCVNPDVDCALKESKNNNRLAAEDGDCGEEHQTNATDRFSATVILPEDNDRDHTDTDREPVEQTASSASLNDSPSSVRQYDVTAACHQHRSPSSSSSVCRQPVPDLTLCVTDRHHQSPPSTPLSASQDSDDCSSSTCSDHCRTEVDVTLTITGACDNTQRQADGVETQVSVSRRLQFQQQQQQAVDMDNIILRDNGARSQSQSQSRPLTRYLPVRGEPLDLLCFVEQAGHFVARCAADIAVDSHSAAGFLVKMGGRIRTWRRRWFVFDRNDRQLAYYVDRTQSTPRRTRRPKGCIDFSQIEDVFVFDRLSSIKSPAPDLTFCVKTSFRTYYMVAPSSEVRQLWMEIIFTGAEGYREFF